MSLEQVEKEIDGITFRYQPLLATPARKLLDDLVQRFGPAVASFVEGLDKADGLNLDTEVNEAALLGGVTRPFGMSLREVFKSMDPKFHADLAEQLGKQSVMVREDGTEPVMNRPIRDVEFATNLFREFKWIAFCLSVQFTDFLEPLQQISLRTVALRAMANTSQSNSTSQSTGTSIGSPPAGGIQ